MEEYEYLIFAFVVLLLNEEDRLGERSRLAYLILQKNKIKAYFNNKLSE